METIDWGKDALAQAPLLMRSSATRVSTLPRWPRRSDAYPVLVVDDDEATCEALVMLLDDAGFTARAAGAGGAALADLRAAPTPLVVLLDLIMPQPDGRDVLRAVAADARLARRHAFIIVTAAADSLVTEAQVEIGRFDAGLMLDTVRKPFDIDAVVAAVERAERGLRSLRGPRAVPAAGESAAADG